MYISIQTCEIICREIINVNSKLKLFYSNIIENILFWLKLYRYGKPRSAVFINYELNCYNMDKILIS